MTSGHFSSLRIDTIRVDRDNRQRKELKDIDVLADSINQHGLIHPIVVTRDLVLVAGECRLAACKLLRHDSISVQFIDEMEPSALRAIELEENVKRAALTWQENCKAVAEYHELRCLEDPKWTQEQTGEVLVIAQNVVSKYVQLVKADIAMPELGLMQADSYTTARDMLDRYNERRAASAKSFVNMMTPQPTTAPALTPVDFIKRERPLIQQADFNEWAPTYSGPKFNFIHCDFPYGIESNKMQQGESVHKFGGYEDTEDNYWRLLKTLCDNLDRICEPSAHIMFWFSMHYYQQTLDFFKANSDFVIDPFPLVWLKSDNKGLLPDRNRGPRRIYETALFGSRGDRKIVHAVSNAINAKTAHEDHMSTKPVLVLEYFFFMFVDDTSMVLDPTCGSGTALRAAKECNASHGLGLEINPEFVESANWALSRQGEAA